MPYGREAEKIAVQTKTAVNQLALTNKALEKRTTESILKAKFEQFLDKLNDVMWLYTKE